MKKKLKKAEDMLKQVTDSNKALKTQVKVLKNTPAPTPIRKNARSEEYYSSDSKDRAGDSSSSSSSDSDLANASDDPPVLFVSSRVPTLTSLLYTTCAKHIFTNR